MATLVQQLDNQSLLLMYASDELPAEDRAEVEQLLAVDGGLRLELDSIRSSLGFAKTALGALDRGEPMSPSSQAVAVRQVGRVMRQWQADRLRTDQTDSVPAARRFPVWAYPAAAVASLVIGSMIWWGIPTHESTELASQNTSYADKNKTIPPAVVVASDDKSTPLDAHAQRLANSFESDAVPAELTDAETQASSLLARSDDAGVTSSIFLTEPGQ